eukprot:evm.model.NODE_31844_length_35418_cov_26.680502.7
MGFINEGVLRKHMVWREANRDSALYSLTNSDWRDGAAEHLEALVKQRLEGVKGLRKLRDEGEEREVLAGGRGAEMSAAAVKRQNLAAELDKEEDAKKVK